MKILPVKYSVVIPTFNRNEKVKRAIKSVIAQCYMDYEIVVVDDCSSDGTYESLLELYSGDNNINIYQLDINSGACEARNYGISKAVGEWIAFLDADDVWKSNKLNCINEIASEHKDACLIYSASDVVNESGKYIRKIGVGSCGNVFNETLINNKIGGTSRVCVKKEIFDNFKFDVNLPSCQDWDLWIRLSKNNIIYNTPHSLVLYEESSDSISSNVRKVIAGWDLLLNKHIDFYSCNLSGFYLKQYIFLRNRGEYFSSLNSYFRYFKFGGYKDKMLLIYTITLLIPIKIIRLIYKG